MMTGRQRNRDCCCCAGDRNNAAVAILSQPFHHGRILVAATTITITTKLLLVLLMMMSVILVGVVVIVSTNRGRMSAISTTTRLPSPSTSGTGHNNIHTPFSLMVQLTFTEVQYQEQFVRDITPLCQYIQQHESNTTLSYEVLFSDQDPLRVLILERYVNQPEAFLQIHKTSAPFLEFRAKLQAMQQHQVVTIDGSSYYDSGIGFVHL
jgi:quinol monooxygenase YgiN